MEVYMSKNDKVKALNTYYEMANREYDRILASFDQIDNKVGFLIAAVVGVPIATIGFAAQLETSDLSIAVVIFGIIGLLAFFGAGYNIVRAVSAKALKYGIPYDEFTRYSPEYGDEAMKEWAADALMESSEFNYKVTMRKARYMQRIFPCLVVEVIFLLAGITYALIGKL
jgi:hypothetical protein